MMSKKKETKEVSPKRGYASDFAEFIKHHADLNYHEQQYVLKVFEQPHIKKTVKVSLILVTWMLIYTAIDGLLLGTAIVHTTVDGFIFFAYLPWLLFTLLNFIAKYTFLNWIDSDGIYTRKQKLLGGAPTVGVFLFLGSVLHGERLVRSSVLRYVRHVRKRGVRFLFNLLTKKIQKK